MGRENAPDERFGARKILILDRILPEIIEKGEIIHRGSHADIPLHEGGEGRKKKDGVAREVMGLELIEIKKAPEKV
jgi:hypothetical protein